MKRFLATTATALVLGTSAYADNHSSSFADVTFDESINLNASELIGMRVYASEADIHNDMTVAADGETEWDDIGDINEIVLTRSGEVQSVIVGVGGFLGLGEKDVAITMDQLKFVSDGEAPDAFFLVVKASVAGVEEAPAYERPERADTAEMEMNKDTAAADYDRPMLTAPEIDREGYASVEPTELTTEDLTGATVYGVNDESVGEVDKLLLTENGELDRAVIDVGGFLGMGERQVALTFEELNIVRSNEDNGLRVYIDSSQQRLMEQPEYNG